MDAAPAPADTGEMFRKYAGYVRGLVVKLGVPPQDAEDAAADIMARLYERDLIGMFDPEHHIEHNGEVIPASFKSFLSAQVALYVRGKRDAITRRSRRELLILDQPADGGSGGTTFAELLGGSHEDDSSKVSADDFITKARGYLAVVSPRSARDKCDLIELFDEMVREVNEDGEFSYVSIQQHFGISSTSAYSWVGWLRECLANAASHLSSCHVAGGVILTEADVASAIKILRKSGGSSVMSPLESAGHKLSTAQAGWHKEFARQEKALYPELAADTGKPDKRRPGVKLAVIHRLERMLPAGLPAEPAESSWDAVEAELWRLGADRLAVGRIFGLVQSAVVSGEEVPAWS